MTENKQENIDLSSSTGGQGAFLLHLADNALLMGQRNSSWTGHGPVLEQDIAITNIALDYLGQARNFYQHAAALYNGFGEEEKAAVEPYLPRPWKTYHRGLEEDDLAFLRDEHQYLNALITELPRGDWAFTVLRQFFFSGFQIHQYKVLQTSTDAQLAAIAEKSVKEVTYHLRWSAEWVIRLGDGTAESRRRIIDALQELWPFTGELFVPAPYETAAGYSADLVSIQTEWLANVTAVFAQAGLDVPKTTWAQSGGKTGRHTEHMGYLLAEMQHLQRTFPNATW